MMQFIRFTSLIVPIASVLRQGQYNTSIGCSDTDKPCNGRCNPVCCYRYRYVLCLNTGSVNDDGKRNKRRRRNIFLFGFLIIYLPSGSHFNQNVSVDVVMISIFDVTRQIVIKQQLICRIYFFYARTLNKKFSGIG